MRKPPASGRKSERTRGAASRAKPTVKKSAAAKASLQSAAVEIGQEATTPPR